MEIPKCDSSACDVLFWMVHTPEGDSIYFSKLSTHEIFQVVGELMEAMMSLPAHQTLGLLDEAGNVGLVTPNRLQ